MKKREMFLDSFISSNNPPLRTKTELNVYKTFIHSYSHSNFSDALNLGHLFLHFEINSLLRNGKST